MRRTGDSIDTTPIGVATRPEVFLAMRRVSSSAVNVARPSPSGISAIWLNVCTQSPGIQVDVAVGLHHRLP